MPAHPHCDSGNEQRQLMPVTIDEVNFVDRGGIVGDSATAEAAEIKVRIKNFAPVLSIGDRLKPDFLLKRDGFSNCRILESAQFLGGDPSRRTFGSRLRQFGRAQPPAYEICQNRRIW